MENIRIGTRLIITFGMLILILVAVTFWQLNLMGEIVENTKEKVDDKSELIATIQRAIVVSQNNARNTLILFLLDEKDLVTKEDLKKEIQKNSILINEITNQIKEKLKTEGEKDQFEQVAVARAKYIASRDKVKELLDKKQFGQAMTTVLGEMKESLDLYHYSWKDFSNFQENELKKVIEQSEKNYLKARIVASVSILFAVVLAGIIAFFVTRSITVPVFEAVQVANKVAIGDLDQIIEAKGENEIGQLLTAMKTMVSYLNEMAKAADLIATGHLEVKITPRSEKDSFGNSFKTMISSINSLVTNIKNNNEELDKKNEELAKFVEELKIAHKETENKNKELAKKNEELIQSHRKADRIFSVLADTLPGTVLDNKYRIEEKIGVGGYGIVYKGIHLRLDRPIAIKVFKPASGNDSVESFERFLLEGVSSCRITHPNAISVWDSGISSEGIAYMVMELLDGRTLAEILKENYKLTPRRCGEIVIPVCFALAEAHRVGIIHRDIKPDNIFLHNTEKGEIVKVLDFGIAKLMDETVTTSSGQNLTMGEGIIGTPTYMSPERLSRKVYDGRSDVYSLGIMLYEMLCGQVPFDAEIFGVVEVVLMHLKSEPEPLRDIEPSVPEDVEKIVLRMLAKNPDERPTIEEVAEDLATVLDLHISQEKLTTGAFDIRTTGSTKLRTGDIKKETKM